MQLGEKETMCLRAIINKIITSVDAEASLSEQQTADLLLRHGTQPAGFVTVNCLS